MSRIDVVPGPALQLRDGTTLHTSLPGNPPTGAGGALILQAKAQVHSRHLSAMLLSESTHFNCMGLVFAARRGHIESYELTRIVRADRYRRVEPGERAMPGDVAVYELEGEAVHVGLVIDFTNPESALILSKWGQDGEYTHRPNDVPLLYGRLSYFFTLRTQRIPNLGAHP